MFVHFYAILFWSIAIQRILGHRFHSALLTKAHRHNCLRFHQVWSALNSTQSQRLCRHKNSVLDPRIHRHRSIHLQSDLRIKPSPNDLSHLIVAPELCLCLLRSPTFSFALQSTIPRGESLLIHLNLAHLTRPPRFGTLAVGSAHFASALLVLPFGFTQFRPLGPAHLTSARLAPLTRLDPFWISPFGSALSLSAYSPQSTWLRTLHFGPSERPT